MVFLCSQLGCNLEYAKFPPFVPNEYLFTKSKFAQKGLDRWEIFAESVRTAMSEEMDLPKSELTVSDSVEYQKILFDGKIKSI